MDNDNSNYQRKDNSGSIFRNDKKTDDRQPGMTGRAMIGGVDYWVSAWKKHSTKTGEVYLSLAFTKVERQASGQTQRVSEVKTVDLEDLPF